MPTRLAAPVLQVDTTKIKQVDTRNVEDLFGIWTVFNKCAESMEDGRRLENLSWRLWNRETFCCRPPHSDSSTSSASSSSLKNSDSIPDLSTSVESAVDDDSDSVRSIKHITSYKFEELVAKIKTKEDLHKLPAPRLSSPRSLIKPQAIPLRVAAADIAVVQPTTASMVPPSQADSTSSQQVLGSEASSEFSTHSIVRGFTPGDKGICSYRSQLRLASTPQPLGSPKPAATALQVAPKFEEKPQSQQRYSHQQKKKTTGFSLGPGSSTDDDSSFDEPSSLRSKQHSHQSSLSDGLRKPGPKKQTSFFIEAPKAIKERRREDEAVFESDSEDDDDEDAISESAIDDDDSDEDWEDSATDSGQSSVNEKHLFQRVDSRPNLRSRRSLLTQMVHQTERQDAFAMKASKSASALIRRSRTSSPNGPSVATSPEEEETSLTMAGPPGITRSKPIIMTTTNTHQPALSPRTTRRNMLASELSESLRKHLIRERQQKTSTASAVLKRRHTAHDVSNLHDYPAGGQRGGANSNHNSSHNTSKNNSWNHYLDDGAGGYHQRGW